MSNASFTFLGSFKIWHVCFHENMQKYLKGYRAWKNIEKEVSLKSPSKQQCVCEPIRKTEKESALSF